MIDPAYGDFLFGTAATMTIVAAGAVCAWGIAIKRARHWKGRYQHELRRLAAANSALSTHEAREARRFGKLAQRNADAQARAAERKEVTLRAVPSLGIAPRAEVVAGVIERRKAKLTSTPQ